MNNLKFELNGRTYHYLHSDGGHAETLTLVHGFGDRKDNWIKFAARFRKKYNLVIPDLPGFGESDKDPTQNFDIVAQAGWLKELLDHLNIQKTHLVGSSMGGWISGVFAAHYPETILSLALMAGAGVHAPVQSEHFRILEETGLSPLLVRNVADFTRYKEFLYTKVPSTTESVHTFMAEEAVNNFELHNKIMGRLFVGGLLEEQKLENFLGQIKAPLLLLWGDNDRVIDISSIQVIQTFLPEAKVSIMKNCGHVPMSERPKESADIYREFLGAIQ